MLRVKLRCHQILLYLIFIFWLNNIYLMGRLSHLNYGTISCQQNPFLIDRLFIYDGRSCQINSFFFYLLKSRMISHDIQYLTGS